MGVRSYLDPHSGRSVPRWDLQYKNDWGQVVGGRIRRLRERREMPLRELAPALLKPDGSSWSRSHLSRIERGYTSAPLHVYLRIAGVLETTPGALLGEDAVERELSPGEALLVDVVREAGLPPATALARIFNPAPR